MGQFLKGHLFIRKAELEKDIPPSGSLSQCSQEFHLGPTVWMAGTQIFGPSSTASARASSGSQREAGQPGLEPELQYGRPALEAAA